MCNARVSVLYFNARLNDEILTFFTFANMRYFRFTFLAIFQTNNFGRILLIKLVDEGDFEYSKTQNYIVCIFRVSIL